MDQLTAALATSFQVTKTENSTDAPHPKFSELYKNRGRVKDQSERRKKILELQKQKRFDYVNHIRRLADDDWKDFVEDTEEERGDDSMDCEVALPGRRYKNQLMLSEWMMEVPEDFESEWLMLPCPVGKRSLVVASRGKTSAFTRSGYRVNTFPSHLPGGNRRQQGGQFSNESTILDCIYSEKDRIFYVIDVMCWNGHPVMDCETEFRFYWMHSKIEEIPDVTEISKFNPYKFLPVPSFSCSPQLISEVMNNHLKYELDGLIFYHKRTHYLFGVTPLVLWLKPYMLPELLNIPVMEEYIASIPPSYTGFANHLDRVKKDKDTAQQTVQRTSPKEKCEKNKYKNCNRKEDMDIGLVENEIPR